MKQISFKEFLENKTLYYEKIDYSIISKSWEIVSKFIKIPYVIHIVGTNGKGSTGRFLAHYLFKKGFDTLHYSSPHILKFNERIWINGDDVSDEKLQIAHEKLQDILPNDYLQKLTYFEYTTLLALILSSNKYYLVLEAGLGGEFDATNVVKNDLSLITKIGLDHQSFLGNTIKEIATTKLRSCDTKMIVSAQDEKDVYKVAKDYKQVPLKEFDTSLLPFPSFLKSNLNTVLTAIQELGLDIDLELFKDIKLFGRCQKIAPNITIDVGHNPLAAKVLAKEFEGKKINLVYNSYKDKDYKEVLKILKPIVNVLFILKVYDTRIVLEENLIEVLKTLNIEYQNFEKIDDDKEYLVFGSFSVVEKFLLGSKFGKQE